MHTAHKSNYAYETTTKGQTRAFSKWKITVENVLSSKLGVLLREFYKAHNRCGFLSFKCPARTPGSGMGSRCLPFKPRARPWDPDGLGISVVRAHSCWPGHTQLASRRQRGPPLRALGGRKRFILLGSSPDVIQIQAIVTVKGLPRVRCCGQEFSRLIESSRVVSPCFIGEEKEIKRDQEVASVMVGPEF